MSLMDSLILDRRVAKVSGRDVPRPSGKTTSAFVDASAAEGLVAEWHRLAAGAVEANPFFDADFLIPAVRNLAPSGTKLVIVRSGEGKLLALAPVKTHHLAVAVPTATVWAHDYGPVGAPLIDAQSPEAAGALLRALTATGRVAVFPYLPLGGEAATALVGAAIRAKMPIGLASQHERAMIQHGEVEGDIRRSLPTKRRKEFARQMRRLGELGVVTIETVSGTAQVRAGFEEFLALEARGWKGKGGTALASSDATRLFATEIVSRLSAIDCCRISAIRVDDRAVAMLVTILSGTTAFSWKIAFDEEFARFSPGAQLMLEAAEALLGEEGIQRIDSLASQDHPMIDHLWRGRRTMGTLVVGPEGGKLRMRAAIAAIRSEAWLKTTAKAALKKLRKRETGEPQ
jgi:CelD/BcsL family acetyltransferase involved in cellulose biosynthesis